MGRRAKLAAVAVVISMLALSGCERNDAQKEIKYSDVIDISMPEENGIFLDKIGDGSLVLARLNTDYGFREYLKTGSNSMSGLFGYLKSQGIPVYEKALKIRSPFCTAFSAQYENGDYILGRNDDLFPDDTAILLLTHPDDGYASVAISDGVYFGYANEEVATEEIKDYMTSLAYFPADGMNECGVAIAQNTSEADSNPSPDKVSIGSLQAVRLVLDYAKDVESAIALLKQYSICFEADEKSHFTISDAKGRSVIVEYVGGEMVVLENDYPWQVNTNFIVSKFTNEQLAAVSGGCLRYETAYRFLHKRDGILKGDEPFDLLRKVIQSHTLYSTVYNKNSGMVQVAMRREFDTVYQFKMDMQ